MWDQSNIIVNLQKKITELETRLSNTISRITTYSTTETEVGRWVDGSPLYRKVIDFGALPNNDTKSVATGLSNIQLTNISGVFWNSTGIGFTIPTIELASLGNGIQILYNKGDVRVRTGVDRSSYDGIIILEYIKTPPATRDGDTDPDSTEDDHK